ncbi:hypothetical protein ACTPEM_24380, partial [Clostridioides difficile]
RRLINKRRKMAEEGVSESKREKVNNLDVIQDDKKLIEGYVAIGIIKTQSVKIKNLVQDLNLVSQLNYNVQPIQETPIHLCKIIRE